MADRTTETELIDAEVARRLAGNVSLRTLDKLIEENGFPKPSKIRRKRFWSRGEVQNWIADRLGEREATA